MPDNPTAQGDPGSLITRDGQLQWGGLLMGPGTRYQLTAEGLTGWHDLPGMDLGDSPRAADHGSTPGTRLAQARTVGATVLAMPGRSTDPAQDWQSVADDPDPATALTELRCHTGLLAGEQWLAVRLHGVVRAVRARVSARVVPPTGSTPSPGWPGWRCSGSAPIRTCTRRSSTRPAPRSAVVAAGSATRWSTRWRTAPPGSAVRWRWSTWATRRPGRC
ncbi:hypothetical protein ACFQ0T_23635 [Kitasatospora gansuensis]